MPRSHRLAAGEVLANRYEIVSLLGRGGMGVVYRAYDRKLDEPIAIKVLRGDLALGAGTIERFHREVKLARRIAHPNVARVFDVAEHGDDVLLTMEIIEGSSLADVLSKQGALPEPRALAIAERIAAGLGAAHAAGVIHRDLKPENVMIEPGGRVVLMDFGIARLAFDSGGTSSTGLALGTPAYMAPEQVESHQIDGRADLYALGAVLFEMLTDRHVWEGESPFAIAAARLLKKPPDPRSIKPGISESTAEIVLRLLARHPADRFSSAEEVMEAIVSAAQGQVMDDGAPPLLRPYDAPLSQRPPRLDSAPLSQRPPRLDSAPLSQRPLLVDAGPLSQRPPAHDAGPISQRPPPYDLEPLSQRALRYEAAPLSRSLHGPSIAVLPFRNLGDPGDEYLAAELAFDLADGLSAARTLRVRPMRTVEDAARGGVDPIAVGRALGVDFVVDGSVRRAGDRLRAQVCLIETAEGFQRWARREERALGDAFGLVDELVRGISAELQISGDRAPRHPPSDPLAVDLLLRARLEMRRIWPAHQADALELLREAERLAPHDPHIAAAQAIALVRRASFGGPISPDARAAAERAVALGPAVGEAHLALGVVLIQHGELEDGVIELHEALRLQPGLVDAHAGLGRVLAEAGAAVEAEACLSRALALDPDHPIALSARARSCALGGDIALGVRMLDDAIARTGQTYFMGPRARLLLWSSDVARATELLAALEDDPAATPVTRALLNVAAQRDFSQLLSMASRGSDPRARAFLLQLVAEAQITAGDLAAAVETVRESAEVGLMDLAWLDGCPLLAELRDQRRFQGARSIVAARAAGVVAAHARGASPAAS